MVKYKIVEPDKAIVELLEYNREGMILATELTRKRTPSISKLVKIGNVEPAIVLKVDK